jgi:hypothetical protein
MHDAQEAAWQSQEAARQGRGGDAADRLVAQALAAPLPINLPVSFAADVARLAQQRTPAASPVFEGVLYVLAATLLLLALGVAIKLNPSLVPNSLDMQGPGGWGLWLAAGVLLTCLTPLAFSNRKPL